MAALVGARFHSLRKRIAILVVAVVMSLGIGLSRVYLGYHWATDVLAGWTVAVVWLVIVLNVAYFVAERGNRSGQQSPDVATGNE